MLFQSIPGFRYIRNWLNPELNNILWNQGIDLYRRIEALRLDPDQKVKSYVSQHHNMNHRAPNRYQSHRDKYQLIHFKECEKTISCQVFDRYSQDGHWLGQFNVGFIPGFIHNIIVDRLTRMPEFMDRPGGGFNVTLNVYHVVNGKIAGFNAHRDIGSKRDRTAVVNIGASSRIILERIDNPSDKMFVNLPSGSIYILSDEARNDWRHQKDAVETNLANGTVAGISYAVGYKFPEEIESK